MNKQYTKGKSVFIKQNSRKKQYQYLAQDIQCDVLVIGGGVTGAITGYYLAKENIDVVLLEKGRIGHGSTSITTSLLQYELDDDAKTLKDVLGKENIVEAYKLGKFALNQIHDFIKEYGNKCHYHQVDSYYYTTKKSNIDNIYKEYLFRKENNFDVEFNKDNITFPRNAKAILKSNLGGATLDPFLYTHHLLDEARKNGLRIYENSEAITIYYKDNYVLVETTYGYTIKCNKIIVTTGYNTELFTERAFGQKHTTFNVVTSKSNHINLLKDSIYRDDGNPYYYFRSTSDKRIIFGGSDISFDGYFKNQKKYEKSYEKLCKEYTNVFNKEIDVEYLCCGAFASTKDNLGFIGKDSQNSRLWYNLGYGANGILFAILGGYYLSKQHIGGENINLDLFSINRFD